MSPYFTSSATFAQRPFDTACVAIARTDIRDVPIWSVRD